MSAGQNEAQDPARPGWGLTLLLSLSAVYCLCFSHLKLFWNDEALTFFTIHHRSLAGIVRFQLSTPLVLEPPTQDLLLRMVAEVFGYSKLALRAPSACFFLLTQWCVYRVAATLGGTRAGWIAATALLGTQCTNYGAEARPYGLLTFLAIAAISLWYRLRAAEVPVQATRDAVLLGLTLALAITTQFLGALVVYPVVIGECVLCGLRRQRPSVRVALAIALGLLAIALDVPFVRAVRPYRPSVAFGATLQWASFLAAYAWGLFREPDFLTGWLPDAWYVWPMLIAAVAGSAVAVWRRGVRRTQGSLDAALWAALAALALLPFPVVLIAVFGTHYFQPRYAVPFVPALLTLGGVGLARFTRPLHGRALGIATVLGFCALTAEAMWVLVLRAEGTRADLQPYATSDEVRDLLTTHPALPVYLSIDECILYPFYGDPAFGSRVRCLYSFAREQQFSQTVLTSITAEVLAQKTDLGLPAVPYSELSSQKEAVVAYGEQPWLAWIPDALEADGAHQTDIDTGLGGEVYRVTFPGKDLAAATPSRRSAADQPR